MKSKYSSRKTIIDGITFDSIKESRRYRDLMLLVKSGKISDLVLQPSFTLQESFKHDGKTERPIHYIADFQYKSGSQIIVEDCKGFKTTEYKLKRKLFLFKYPEFTFIET